MNNDKILEINTLLTEINEVYHQKSVESGEQKNKPAKDKTKGLLLRLFLLSASSVVSMLVAMFLLAIEFKNNEMSDIPMCFILISFLSGLLLCDTFNCLVDMNELKCNTKMPTFSDETVREKGIDTLCIFSLSKEKSLAFFHEVELIVGIDELSSTMEELKKSLNTHNVNNLYFIQKLLTTLQNKLQ